MELETLDARKGDVGGRKKLEDCLKNISPELESTSPAFNRQTFANSALAAAENCDFQGFCAKLNGVIFFTL